MRMRRQGVWIFVVLAFALGLAIVYVVPLVLLSGGGFDVQSRLKAEADLRSVLVQAIGGSILLYGTTRSLYIGREGQIADRFTRAVEYLGQSGEDKLECRLGGIYALERIARASRMDREPTRDILVAFIHQHALWVPEVAAVKRGDALRLRADVQAAITVLVRNAWNPRSTIDLRNVDLRGADLFRARLQGALLDGANLEGADLREARLTGASMFNAELQGARLERAQTSVSRRQTGV